MFQVYQRARDEAGYTAKIFFQMLSERGGLQTAKSLINAANASEGYTALWERGRLDLTVEAIITDNRRWQPLFKPEELERARRRLEQYGYKVPPPGTS